MINSMAVRICHNNVTIRFQNKAILSTNTTRTTVLSSRIFYIENREILGIVGEYCDKSVTNV